MRSIGSFILQSLCVGSLLLSPAIASAQNAGVETGVIRSTVVKPLKAAEVPFGAPSKPLVDAEQAPKLPPPPGEMPLQSPDALPTPTSAPPTPLPEPAAPALSSAPSASLSQTIKVGLLVPLTGERAKEGQAVLDAALLGLYDVDKTTRYREASLELLPKNTRGETDGAKQAAVEAIQDGASLLLGVLTDAEMEAVAPVLQSTKVWAFSFNANPVIKNPFIVQCGYFSGQQVERLVAYAVKRGASKMAAMGPTSAHGRTVLDEFNKSMSRRGLSPVKVVAYGEDARNLTLEAQPLAEALVPITRDHGVGLFLNMNAPDAEAVLKHLVMRHKIPRNYLLVFGTNRWDNKAARNQYTMQDTIYTATTQHLFEKFTQRFEGSYHYEPSRQAGMSYDLAILFGKLAAQAGRAGLTPAQWGNPDGFFGPANGLFRVRNDQVCERGYALMKTDGRGKTTVLDPAPPAFPEAE